jgi:hypothetical protein
VTGRAKVFQTALDSVKLDGLLLEFGVFRGETINRISNFFPDRTVFGFDSFEGLPDDFTPWLLKGTFSLDGELPEVNDNIVLVKGWFEDTLQTFLNVNKRKVALVNFDADLYSSTKFVLDTLLENNRLISGTILHFDEFIHPEYSGEMRAFVEAGIPSRLIDYYITIEGYQSSFAFEVI